MVFPKNQSAVLCTLLFILICCCYSFLVITRAGSIHNGLQRLGHLLASYVGGSGEIEKGKYEGISMKALYVDRGGMDLERESEAGSLVG